MFCEICSKFNENPIYNDCVIEYLEKIKLHYNCVKTDFQDAKSSSIRLEIENENLRKKISALEQKFLSISNSPCKKRKTNSPIENDTINTNDNKNSTSLSKESSEELVYELNKAMDITDVDWSDSFHLQNDNHTPKKCTINSHLDKDETPDLSPRKILSPLNRENSPVSSSPQKLSSSSPPACSSPLNYTHLPRRLKVSSSISKPKKNNENQNPETSSKWIVSKESKNLNKTFKRDFGMSFIQPQKSASNLSPKNSSEITDKIKKSTNMKSPRKNLSLTKSQPKLRQQRLLFDIIKNENQEQKTDNDETFCDDIIQPSPTSALIQYAEEGGKTKKKSLINFSRKKFENNLFDFSSSKKPIKTELSTPSNNDKRCYENKSKFENNLNEKKDTQNQSDNNTSSVIMIPNEPDDVIVIDNTNIDYNKFSVRNFIDEMVIKSPDISTFCDVINYGDHDFKKSKPDTDEKNQENTNLDEILKSACSDCREYFKYIGRNLTAEEIQLRLRNCKHKNTFEMNPTPEGFWDPLFNHFSENDPRNETLIDDRFIVNKNK